MKVKHAPEQSMGQRNNRKNKNILKYIKMEITAQTNLWEAT